MSDPYPVEMTHPLVHLLVLSGNLLGLLNLREDVCSAAHGKALQSPAMEAISIILDLFLKSAGFWGFFFKSAT